MFTIRNPHANRAVMMKYVEAMNRGDIAAFKKIFTEDAVVYGEWGAGGLDVAQPIWRAPHDCLAMELTVEKKVAEGDRVAVRSTERGPSTKPFRGKPATGKSYRIHARMVCHQGWPDRRTLDHPRLRSHVQADENALTAGGPPIP